MVDTASGSLGTYTIGSASKSLTAASFDSAVSSCAGHGVLVTLLEIVSPCCLIFYSSSRLTDWHAISALGYASGSATVRVARKPRIMKEARILNWWKVENFGNGVSRIKTGTKSATESSIIIEDTVKTPATCGFRLDARARK